MGLIARLQERVLGIAPWDASQISDEWFRAHFEYAADVVNQWIGGVMDIPRSRFLNFGGGDGITGHDEGLRVAFPVVNAV